MTSIFTQHKISIGNITQYFGIREEGIHTVESIVENLKSSKTK